MGLIRVLIIDDSAFMRKMITNILSSDKRIQVVGVARNGEDGLTKIKEASPDVVTLDVEMPVMDGITTLEKIMNSNPLPVIMLSSVTQKGATKTLQAVSLGAVDFIAKPSGSISLDINKIKQEIIDKVIMASEAKVNNTRPTQKKDLKIEASQSYNKSLIAIGTSTGGPRALQKILTELPSNFPAPIIIVQHMPAYFTKTLAGRLDSLSDLHVKEAGHGEVIKKGIAYIAPGDYHIKIRQAGTAYAIELSQGPHIHGHRPSVDILFQSLAHLTQINKIAVVLTGMGRDGSEGIIEMKQRDQEALIIAEAKESSVVYGMPAEAVKTGHVNLISHLEEIGESITNLIRKSRG